MADPSAGYSWWGGGGDTELWKREDNAIYQLPLTANVGIGVTNPAARLDVLGDTKVTGTVLVSANVGIGVTNPEYPLQVTGTIQASRVLGVDYPDITNPPPVPVQSDWTESDPTSLAFVKNKPPAINGQVQSDWDQTNSTAVNYIKNKPKEYLNDNGFYIDFNRTSNIYTGYPSGTQINGQVTGRWALDDSVSTDAVLCKYDENRFTMTRGLVIHNAGNYYEGSNSILPSQIQDWADNRSIYENGTTEPSLGRLWHAFPRLADETDGNVTVINLPKDSVWYDININGIPHRVREILDGKGYMNFWNLKNIPAICEADVDLEDILYLSIWSGIVATLLALGFTASRISKTFGNAFARFFNFTKDDAYTPSTPEEDEDKFVVPVRWSQIQDRPFAAPVYAPTANSTNAEFSFGGDIRLSNRIRYVHPSAFTISSSTGSAKCDATESQMTTLIDCESREFFGKQYFASYDGSTHLAVTGQGIAFSSSLNNVTNPDNFVLTKNYIEFKVGNTAWRFTKDGISHKNQSGVFKSVLWWDGDGQDWDNYHIFAQANSEQPESIQETPQQTLIERVGGFFQNRTQRGGAEIQPARVTPAVQTGTAQPSVIQRADDVFETVASRATAVGRNAQRGAQEAAARGFLGIRAFGQNFVRGAKKVGRSVETAFEKVENGKAAKAAGRAGQDAARNFKRGVADAWRNVKRAVS